MLDRREWQISGLRRAHLPIYLLHYYAALEHRCQSVARYMRRGDPDGTTQSLLVIKCKIVRCSCLNKGFPKGPTCMNFLVNAYCTAWETLPSHLLGSEWPQSLWHMLTEHPYRRHPPTPSDYGLRKNAPANVTMQTWTFHPQHKAHILSKEIRFFESSSRQAKPITRQHRSHFVVAL
jgi:hypothetical protein